MKSSIPHVTALAAGLLLAAPALAGTPTMSDYWPNTDGLSWRYDQHYEENDGDPVTVDNRLRLLFDGTTVAAGGVDAQYLRQELLAGAASRLRLDAMVPDPLLRTLWTARPELRDRILEASGAGCPGVHPPGSYAVLLGGEFAWKETATEIAAWRCNLDNTKSWTWLVSNVSVGNTFTLQLIPDLASDVMLHGTMAAIEDATVPAGTFHNTLRVDYVIDYGGSACTDDAGTPHGTYRSETHGFVRYAPGVGPVESYEEFIRYAEQSDDCVAPSEIGRVTASASLKLSSGPVPVRPMSWAGVKTLYR